MLLEFLVLVLVCCNAALYMVLYKQARGLIHATPSL